MSAKKNDQTGQQDRERLLSKAYGQANAMLRNKHTDEFNGYYAERAAALGVEWSPRPTPEQKAETEMRDLLAAYPHLADLFREDAEAE
jgi:hypothetical protein